MRPLGFTFTLTTLAGCAFWSAPRPLAQISNPVPALSEISVIPVGAETISGSERWTRQLHDALLRVEGVERVRGIPPRVEDEAASTSVTELAETTQCLLEVNVLSFDAYFPPSARLEVNLYLPFHTARSGWDPLTLDRLGTGPGSATTSDRGPWIRFQTRYSADDAEVMEKLRRYAGSLPNQERGFDPVDSVLRVSDRYIDFVLYETLKECFSRIDTKERESDGFLSKLLNVGSRP